MHETPRVVIIGAGFGGLSLAALLAKDGYAVQVLEKNDDVGGRAMVYSDQGHTFDMGPSWYLMPDVFETFFQRLGVDSDSLFSLVRLDPSYRIFFGPGDYLDISADLEPTLTSLSVWRPVLGSNCAPICPKRRMSTMSRSTSSSTATT